MINFAKYYGIQQQNSQVFNKNAVKKDNIIAENNLLESSESQQLEYQDHINLKRN